MEPYTREEIDKIIQSISEITEENYQEPIEKIPDETLRSMLIRYFQSELDDAISQRFTDEMSEYIIQKIGNDDFAYAFQSEELSSVLIEQNTVEKHYERFLAILPEMIAQGSNALPELWGYLKPEEQNEWLAEVAQKFQDNPANLSLVWRRTNQEVQLKQEELHPHLFQSIMDAIGRDSGRMDSVFSYTHPDIIRGMDTRVLAEILERASDSSYFVGKIAGKIENAQLQEVFQILSEKEEVNSEVLLEVWKAFKDLQILKKLIADSEKLKENPMVLEDLWKEISSKQKEEIFADVLALAKDSRVEFSKMWDQTDLLLQSKELMTVVDAFKDRRDLSEIWQSTKKELQEEKLLEVLHHLEEENHTLAVETIWKNSTALARMHQILAEHIDPSVKKLMKDTNNIELMQEEVSFSEKIRKVLLQIDSEETASKVEAKLSVIVSQWPQIEKQFQYIKANAILKDGLEMRNIGVEDVLKIADSLERVKPMSVSAEEFERTKGSEKVGLDTQFTASASTAVQRAHTLSEKMDAAGSKKTFADFSVEAEDGNMTLKCLHPQDKSQILLRV